MKRLLGLSYVLICLILFADDANLNVDLEGLDESKSERIALVVGVSQYSSVKTSSYIENDCKNIKSALEQYGDFNVISITSKGKKSPTKDNIINALSEIKENANQYKTFLFYYAGFSFNLDDINYIAPSDTDFGNPKKTAINIEDLLSILKDIKKTTKVAVFMDYGRVNLNSFMGKGMPFPEIPTKDFNLSVLYSSDGKTPSYDFDEKKSSVFSYYLYEALSKESNITNYSNNDGYTTVNEAVGYITEQITIWSMNNKPDFVQVPVFTSSKDSDFVLTKSAAGSSYSLKSIDFYEGTEAKNFRKKFSQKDATYIGFRLVLNIEPADYETITLKAVYIDQDKKVMTEIKKSYDKEQIEGNEIIFSKRFGYKRAGYWSTGEYNVRFYLNDEEIGDDTFIIK